MRVVFSNPFEAEGHWFRGNLHAHTLNSDGQMSVEQLVARYRETGYDFLSITDHGRLTDTRGLSTPDFLLIPGEEVSVGSSEAGRFIHVVGVNIRDEIPVGDFDRESDPQEAIDVIRGLGGLALVAHPYWSGLNHGDLVGLRGHLGLEVFNTHCELTIGRGLSSVHWDNLLSAGLRPLGLAVDDAHGREKPYQPSDSCGAWINVKAWSLTAEDIVDGIARGLFYSSNGPEIKEIGIDSGEIMVLSSPARSIAFISNGGYGEKSTVEAGFLEEAVYNLRGPERYVRVEVSDWDGRTAWSNPLFIET